MYIFARHWRKENRSDRIKQIVEALNRTGNAKSEYFKGRPHLLTLLFGKGHPEPLQEDYDWNIATITYNGKKAVKIFCTDVGFDGWLFDETVTASEIQHLKSALFEANVYVKKVFKSIKMYMRACTVGGIFFGCIMVGAALVSLDLVWLVLSPLYLICFLVLFFRI